MRFLKEHVKTRAALIAALFVLGLVLVFWGWSMTGTVSGLIVMLAGVAGLLSALFVYNKPFE